MRLNYWGAAQSVETVFEGVAFVSSSSHGGIVLSEEMNRHVPNEMRNDEGCYEEDVDWAIAWAALRKAGILADDLVTQGKSAPSIDLIAAQTLNRWRPDAVKPLLGMDPDPESPILLQRKDYQEAREKGWFLAVSATAASATNSVPEGLVGVILAPAHMQEDREDRTREFNALIDANIYADSRLKSGLRIFDESEIIRIDKDPWSRPDADILSPEEAYDIASSWGVYNTGSEPGAVFYSFPPGDARPADFEHRRALLDYTRDCKQIAEERAAGYAELTSLEKKDYPWGDPAESLEELRRLEAFFLISEDRPEVSFEGPEL